MNALISYYKSSIGKKTVVAITGILLVMFVLGHMLGNLQIFIGAAAINSYAYHLQSLGPFLWVIRLSLLAIIGVHILTALLLVIQNYKARPEKYAVNSPTKSTFASRTMVWSGLIILAFIFFHIAHYTARKVPGQEFNHEIVAADGTHYPEEVALLSGGEPVFELTADGSEQVMTHNVHDMMIAGFSHWWVSVFYILAMFLLCTHLSHGFASLFQTLGLRTPKTAGGLCIFSKIFAWGIFAGYVSIPLAILTGFLK